MTNSEKEWLESICKNCLEANGYCIKNEAYIGLCSKNDRDELLEMKRSSSQNVKINK